MGILDDAIREHLDLKRRLGAEEDELQRLEDEAFGPPSRPGEPDFPETGESEAAESIAVEERPDEQGLPEEPAEPIEQAGGPKGSLREDGGDEPAEADAQVAEEPEPEPAASGQEGEAEGGGFYDQSGDELDLTLDLDEDDEPAAPAESRPIEAEDTVEHRFEDAIEETGEAAPVREPGTGEEPMTDEEEVVEGELADRGDEEEEDVLEETPEFLRDAPEDDELWFEQGEPKDFDF